MKKNMFNKGIMPFLALTILISMAPLLGMDVSSSGAPASGSGSQRTTPADIAGLAKDKSTFFSTLPRELVQMVGPLVDDTATVAQIIDQTNKIEDLLANPELKRKLSFKEDYIGQLMRDKFREDINKPYGPYGIQNPPIIFSAIDRGLVGMVQLLLAAGVPIEITNDNKISLLSSAVATNQADVVELLLEKGANVKTDPELLSMAIHFSSHDDPKIFDMLLAKGLKLNESSLYRAASAGRVGVIKRLLASGFDIHKADEWGRTPLFYASFDGHPDAVQELLKLGAGSDINRKDSYFNATPFWALASASTWMSNIPNAKKRIIETAQLLLKAGADPTIPSGDISPEAGLQTQSNKAPEEIAIPEIKELIEQWKEKHGK